MTIATRNRLTGIIICILSVWSIYAQPTTAMKRQGNVFYFSGAGGDTRIEFCTSSMFRVRTSWTKVFEPNEPWMVVKYEWRVLLIANSSVKN
jgi:hypothetical protein